MNPSLLTIPPELPKPKRIRTTPSSDSSPLNTPSAIPPNSTSPRSEPWDLYATRRPSTNSVSSRSGSRAPTQSPHPLSNSLLPQDNSDASSSSRLPTKSGVHRVGRGEKEHTPSNLLYYDADGQKFLKMVKVDVSGTIATKDLFPEVHNARDVLLEKCWTDVSTEKDNNKPATFDDLNTDLKVLVRSNSNNNLVGSCPWFTDKSFGCSFMITYQHVEVESRLLLRRSSSPRLVSKIPWQASIL